MARFSEKNFIGHKMYVSSFFVAFDWDFFHSKRNWARCDKKYILVFMQRILYSCPILMKLLFSQQIFEKILV
jgi:hypothetical protein